MEIQKTGKGFKVTLQFNAQFPRRDYQTLQRASQPRNISNPIELYFFNFKISCKRNTVEEAVKEIESFLSKGSRPVDSMPVNGKVLL